MKLTCLVDNAVLPNSSFWGEHGLAYLVEAGGQCVLFDTGQSGTVLLHNLRQLGIDPATLSALAISHAHYDHTGGLPALLPLLRPGTPLYANTDLFRARFSQREGSPKFIGLPLGREELSARLTLKLSDAPQEIAPGVWTSGEVRQRTEFEGRGTNLLMAAEGELAADAYRDDMALVLRSGGRLALLCGCCHAGVLNTLMHIESIFSLPVALIAGGLHLAGVTEIELGRATTRLAALPAASSARPCIFPGHCTGETAFLILAQALDAGAVRSSRAGAMIEFA
jgi:7,8-dihydropterin-6-yl-methyl-4-(beta-D-ribofuranosyl)aminobenzene 5'-phosphate synthase